MKKILQVVLIILAVGIFIYYEAKVPETIEVSYRVRAGDTLWHVICNRVSNNYDVREYIYYTTQKNDIKNARLEPGSDIILVLPKED